MYEKVATLKEGEAEKIPLCAECGHIFHYNLCFATIDVGRAFTQCRCKKGVREDAS